MGFRASVTGKDLETREVSEEEPNLGKRFPWERVRVSPQESFTMGAEVLQDDLGPQL